MHRPPAYNIPGVPAAPVGRKFLIAVDRYFLEKKKELSDRIPIFNKEEIAKRKNPYHVVILHEMMMEGYFHAVHELNKLLRREETEIKSGTFKGVPLVEQKDKFFRVSEVLKVCQDYEEEENFEAAALVRMEMGESLLKTNDNWLAKHFLFTTLRETNRMKVAEESYKNKIQAEIHCVLAFIARDNASNLEEALESAVSHLVVSRELAKDQSWQFKMHTITIKLKKPIAIHGLRDEYETIDGSSMTLYYISTLLEHEMLIGLANEILHHHKYFTDDEIRQSREFADRALQFAYEVLHPVALNSALLRFGIVLRHCQEFDDALGYFTQLAHHAEVTSDEESLAIAYHNIALCELGRHRALAAVVFLAKQKAIADMFELDDLVADALEELGRVLLSEGQVPESELCFEIAYEQFKKFSDLNPTNTQLHEHLNLCLIMRGVSAGQNLWSRFSGIARSETYDHVMALANWKLNRKPLPPVGRPIYEVEHIEDVMEKFNQQDKLSKADHELEQDSRPPSMKPSQEEFEAYNFDDDFDTEEYLSDYRAPPISSIYELEIGGEDEEAETMEIGPSWTPLKGSNTASVLKLGTSKKPKSVTIKENLREETEEEDDEQYYADEYEE